MNLVVVMGAHEILIESACLSVLVMRVSISEYNGATRRDFQYSLVSQSGETASHSCFISRGNMSLVNRDSARLSRRFHCWPKDCTVGSGFSLIAISRLSFSFLLFDNRSQSEDLHWCWVEHSFFVERFRDFFLQRSTSAPVLFSIPVLLACCTMRLLEVIRLLYHLFSAQVLLLVGIPAVPSVHRGVRLLLRLFYSHPSSASHACRISSFLTRILEVPRHHVKDLISPC